MLPQWIRNLLKTLPIATTTATRKHETTKLRIAELEDRTVPAFAEFIDPNPNPGNQFGLHVVPLSTGNVVITSPFDDFGGTDAGAVYLFNGATGALISTLRGSTADNIGDNGVVALTNGNYVVSSSFWDNGSATNAGAVTWGNGTTGITGVVSDSNSLVGTTANDKIGLSGVVALTNGHYVVRSALWDNGSTTDAGAVTWGNGTTGTTGVVSDSNSLVGTLADDIVGSNGVLALTNGNYVVSSTRWDNGSATDAGAVTWANGTTGISGAISDSNSLVGGSTGDNIGNGVVVALTNGNYVFSSFYWDDGAKTDAGAVTWANGTTSTAGVVSASNSLVGTTANDYIGLGGVVALANGHYVVSGPYWDNGSAIDVGAVTWGNGTTGISGAISATNSVVGLSASTNLQLGIAADNFNVTFAGQFISEGGGKVRVGSQSTGFLFGSISASLSSGNLTITDTDGTKNNTLTIARSGANIVVTDTSGEIFAETGTNTYTVPLASITGTITINSAGGNDTLTVNYSGGALPLITFNGGLGNDKLRVVGNGSTITSRPDGATLVTDPKSGKINIGATVDAITYTGIEPLDINGAGGAVVITPSAAADALTIVNGFDLTGLGTTPALVVSGTTGGGFFETHAVWNASSLTIDTTTVDAADTITITSASNAHNIASLSIITGTGTDAVNINGPINVTGSVSINTQNVNSTAAGTITTGTGLTITNTGTASTLAGIISGPSATLTKAGTGTLVLSGANTYGGGTAVNVGLLNVKATPTVNPLSTGTVTLAGGTLDVDAAAPVLTNTLGHAGFHTNVENNVLDLNANLGGMGGGDVLAGPAFEGLGVLVNGPGNRGLDFDNDADFAAVPASLRDDTSGDGFVINQADNYTNIFFGTFTPSTTGTWGFRNAGDDDRGGMWIDLDQDGLFESNPPGLGDARGEQISWENGTKRNFNLVAGQKYLVAFTHLEFGGGSGIDIRITDPANVERVVKPGDAAQAGWWSLTNQMNVPLGNNVLVTANSTINVDSAVTFGTLNVAAAATQIDIVSGHALGTSAGKVNFSGTTTLDGVKTIAHSNQAALNLAGVVQNGGAAGGINKTGNGVLTLAGNNTYGGDTTIAGGTVALGNNGGLGNETGKTVINGGTLDLRGFRAGANGNELVEVQGTGVGGFGAINNSGGTQQTSAFRRLTLTGNTTLRSTFRWDVRNTGGAATFDMGGFTLTKVGGQEIAVVSSAINNEGNVNVNESVFRLEGSSIFDDATRTISVVNGATLDFWNTSATHNMNVTLAGGANLTSNGGSNAIVAGTITLNGTANINTNNNSGLSNLTLSGQVTGVGGITKGGSERLTLTNNTSNYAGLTSVNTGTLVATANNALGTTAGGTTVASGATLHFNATPSAISNAEPLIISGAGVNAAGALQSSTNGVTLSGNIILVGDSSIGNNTTGSVFAINGGINRSSNANLMVLGNGNVDVNSNIADAGYTLSPFTARAYNGVQQAIDDPVVITNDVNGTTSATRTATLNGPLTFANAAAFNALFTPSIPLADNFTTVFQTTLTVTTPGVFTFSVTNNDDGAAVWLKPSANPSFVAGDLLQGVVGNNNTAVATRTLAVGTYTLVYAHREGAGGEAVTGRLVGPGQTGITNGTLLPIANPVNATNNLTKNGAGTLTLSQANTYRGTTTVNGGTLLLSGATATLGSSAAGTVVEAGATLALQGGVTVSNEALTLNGTGAVGQLGTLVSVSGTNIVAASSPMTAKAVNLGEIRIATVAGDLTVDSAIDLQSSRLSVDGAGNTTLNGAISGLGVTVGTPPPATSTSVFANVPEATGYTLAYDVSTLPNNVNGANPFPYTANNTGVIGAFDRVAYFVELNSTWVYVSMDAFTSNLAQIGIPNGASLHTFQQFVSNMNVFASGGSGITTGTGITTGNIEIWPSNYSQGNTLPVPNASSAGDNTGFDFGDGGFNAGLGYGSFQIHNYDLDGTGAGTAGQTLFAYNNWRSTGGDLGIGNRGVAGQANDYTFAGNLPSYATRRMAILVREVTPSYRQANNSLTKSGAGTLTLGGANTYNGTTTVNAGTLLVNGSLVDGTGTPDVVVNNAAVLGGTGTINGTVQLNNTSRLAPGTSVESLATGTVTWNSGTFFDVELDGTAGAGVVGGHDILNVTGGVNLGGATLALTGTHVPLGTTLQKFVIIDNDGSDAVVGQFAGLSEGAEINFGGGKLYLSYFGDATTSGAGNDVVLYSQPVINGTPGADIVTVTPADVAGNITITYSLNNGGLTGSVTTTAPPHAFTFSGGGNDDTLNVLLNSLTALPGGITFDGEGQASPANTGGNPTFGDVLHVEGTGSQTATYLSHPTIARAGTINATGLGTINFTGLEPVNMFGMATANVNFSNSNDVIAIDNGFGATVPTAADPATVVSGTSNAVVFEQVHLRNNTTVHINTVTGGVDGNDAITVNTASNAHGNTSLTINTGTGTDTVTFLGNATITGAAIVNSQAIAFNGGTLSATTSANLNAGTGAITTSGTGVDVSTSSLLATATTGINLDTTVATIVANNTGAGNINIDETDGATVQSVTASNGSATITTATNDLLVSSVLVTGTATLTATAGGITDNNGAGNNIAATSLVASATTGIDLDVQVTNITATNTGAGNITIDEGNGANVLNVAASNGSATVTSATGDLNVTTMSASTTATLTATTGALTDANGGTNNITATSLIASAVTGINLDTTVTNITATTSGAGNINIDESNGANVLNVAASNGTATVTSATGNLNVTTVSASTTATLTATAGAITDANGVGNNIAATSLVASATTGIDLDTTVTNITATNSGAGNINIDELDGANVLNVAASNGTATVTSATGNLNVTTVSASTTATLTATAGAITDANGPTNNITAVDLQATAATGIDIDTTLASVTATTTGAGSILLDELNAITLTNVTSANGLITINAGGTITATNVVSSTDSDANDISLTATNGGDISVGTINAGTANGDVTLSANTTPAAQIVDDLNDGTRITGDVVTLTAFADIGVNSGTGNLDTAANTINAATTGTPLAGGIWIDELDGVNLNSVTTVDGLIRVTTGGATTATNVVAGGTTRNVSIINATGGVAVDTVTAALDRVTITTVSGAITDLNGATNNITANQLVLNATTGIAASGDPLETTVSQLDADNTVSGGMYIVNAGALTILDLDSDGFGIRAIGGGFITATSPLTISSNSTIGASMTLTAGNSVAVNDTFTIDSGAVVSVNGGAPSTLTVNAGDDIVFNTGSIVASNAAHQVILNANLDGAGDTDWGTITQVTNATSISGTVDLQGNAVEVGTAVQPLVFDADFLSMNTTAGSGAVGQTRNQWLREVGSVTLNNVAGGGLNAGVSTTGPVTGTIFLTNGTFNHSTTAGDAINDGNAVVLQNTATLGLQTQTETIGSLEGSSATTLALGSGTLTTGGNNQSTTMAGTITGATGSLVKEGSGIFTLTNTNPYSSLATGSTQVNAGTLLVNGANTGTGPVNIASGATLGGTGTIAGQVNAPAGANISPGSPVGTTADLGTGNLNMSPNSIFTVQLNSTTANTGHDQLDVTGTVTLGTPNTNSPNPLLVLTGTVVPAIGQRFVIIDNDGVDPVVGNFDNYLQGAPIYNFFGSGLTAHVNYASNSAGTTGNDVVISLFPVVVMPNGDLHVYGNSANNIITFSPDPNVPGSTRVVMDNVYYGSYAISSPNVVRTFAAGGTDTVIIAGTNANDTFDVLADVTNPDSLRDKEFVFNGLTFTTHAAEAYQLKAGGGSNTFNVYGLGVRAGSVANDTNVFLEGGIGADQINSFLTLADVGGNARTDWNILGPQRGNIEGLLTFNWVEEAEGNELDDYYTFLNGATMPSAPGLIAGVVGNGGVNTMDMIASTTAVNITITSVNANVNTMTTSQGPARDINNLIGSNATTDRITGANLPATWNITALNAGNYDLGQPPAINFTGFETLVGGSGVDTFDFDTNGRITGQIDGGSQPINTRDIVDLSGRTEDFTVGVSPATIKHGPLLANNLVGTWTSFEEIRGSTGDNTLVASNGGNTWTLNGVNDGTLNALTFLDFATLQGGTSTDNFLVANGSATSISGGSGTDTLSYAGTGSAVTVNLNSTTGGASGGGTNVTSFSGIDSLVGGGSSSDTLVGTPLGDAIMINGNGSGTVNTSLPFTGFETLNGGMGNDTYTVTTINVPTVARIDAGGGVDTLIGANRTNAWLVDGSNTGTLNGGLRFVNMENLTGGSGVDNFDFIAATITGTLNGGGQNDILQVGNRNVALSSNINGTATGGAGTINYLSIENLQATGANTLTGANIANIWRLTASNAGTLNSATLFSGFANLVGNANQDRLQPYQGSVVSFDAVGLNAGSDVLDYAGTSTLAVPRPYNVTPTMLASGTVLSGIIGQTINILNFEIVSGNIYA